MRRVLLKVFISSVLQGHLEERKVLAEALRSSGLADDWRFETAPASSEPLVESYLEEIRESDGVILLLKDRITEPVLKEYREARAYNKPVLVFLDADAVPDEELQTFLRIELQERYRQYRGLPDLRSEVQRALYTELIQGYRKNRSTNRESGSRVRARIGIVGGDATLGSLFKGPSGEVRQPEPQSEIDLEIGCVEGDLAAGDLHKDS